MTTLVQTFLTSLGYISKTRIVDWEYKHTRLLNVIQISFRKVVALHIYQVLLMLPIFLLTNLNFLILSRLDVIIQDT